MQLILILIVIAGGMGLSVEAGLLGPLGGRSVTFGPPSVYLAWARR
jgi:hypothetical protein